MRSLNLSRFDGFDGNEQDLFATDVNIFEAQALLGLTDSDEDCDWNPGDDYSVVVGGSLVIGEWLSLGEAIDLVNAKHDAYPGQKIEAIFEPTGRVDYFIADLGVF